MIKWESKEMVKYRSAYTLIEVVITIAILAIVSLGAISYQFHAVQQARVGNTKMAAARIGSLLLENWKSFGGSDTYDPTALNLGIAKLNEGGNMYSVTVDGVPFYMSLLSRDIDTSAITGVTLRELSVFVQWRPDYQQETPEVSDPGSTFYTYVRRDQSGG